MTTSTTDELYYDAWHADLNADPCPMFKRIRDEAPAVRGFDSMPAHV